MLKLSILVLFMMMTVCADAHAQSSNVAATDAAAIKQTALDYIEGWYAGNAERMERSLHPELAKRIVHTDPNTGTSRLDQMGARTLAQRTRSDRGTKTPTATQ